MCAVLAGVLAIQARFVSQGSQPAAYLAFTFAIPLLWVGAIALAGGYDPRFIGVGSDEFRRVLNAGVSLTGAVAIVSYTFRLNVARRYVAVAMPSATLLDLVMRYWLRKHLHKMRDAGQCLRRVVVVGHAPAAAELAAMLRRSNYHGMSIVGACLAGASRPPKIADVPVFGGLDSVSGAVDRFGADTVAVLACPEMNGIRLRELGWALEETGTELCVASALLDVAGPRTTIRPIAGLPLLHVEQAELGGAKRLIKGVFDRLIAGAAPAYAVARLRGDCAGHPGRRPRAAVLPAEAGRQGRSDVLAVEVPDDGRGRRGTPGSTGQAQRGGRGAVQNAARSAGDEGGQVAAPLVTG